MPDEGDRVAYVVDDEATVRRSLALLLRSAGFTVRGFDCGEAFLRAVAADALPFGCVLLDLRMPGMDGLAVQREMAARGVKLPVVVVTAHGDVALAVQAMKAGACDFIEKPYDAETILQAAEAVDRHRVGPPPAAGHKRLTSLRNSADKWGPERR